ncbi:MAG: HDOD domain-containing protein [Candidatus Solibacter sp.]|nr:HDOD domain-containing protein [Candidatus Solibacter sp.]
MSLDDTAEQAHCRRTAALAVELGRRAGVAVEPLAQAALLHHSLEPLRHSSGLGRLAWQVLCGDDQRRIADIVQVCNLVDEQMEALEFEYKEVETIFEEIQSFAAFEEFDPALVEQLREMRCREFPRELKLPVEGGAARLVCHTLRTHRECENRELEVIALRDPVLASSLLNVANSALYGRAQRVSTVSRAIATVGVIAARKVMLAAAMRPLFASAGLQRIWGHSLSSAPLWSALAGHTGLLSAEEGLVLGLVHDIGAVAVQFLPRETLTTHRNLVEGGCPASYVERLLLGRDHGEIGAGLIAEWHFPEEFIDAVRFHHQPERSTSKLASMAYLAEFWSGLGEDLPSFGRVEACLARVDITLETLMEMGSQDSTLRMLKAVA